MIKINKIIGILILILMLINVNISYASIEVLPPENKDNTLRVQTISRGLSDYSVANNCRLIPTGHVNTYICGTKRVTADYDGNIIFEDNFILYMIILVTVIFGIIFGIITYMASVSRR